MDIYDLLCLIDAIFGILTIVFMWVRRKNKVQSGAAFLILFGIVIPQFLLYDMSLRSLNLELWSVFFAWGCIRLYMHAFHDEEIEDEESKEDEQELTDEMKEQAEKVYLQNERELLMYGKSKLLDVVHISKLGESFLIVSIETDPSQEGGSSSTVQKQCVLRYAQNASAGDKFEIVSRNMRDGILAIYNNVNCTQYLIKGRLSEQIEEDRDYICRHLD